MGRTNQSKLCYACAVRIGTTLLHSGNYPTLSSIAKDLGLTYAQVADISIGRSKKFDSNFKYQPRIEIKKLSDGDHEYEYNRETGQVKVHAKKKQIFE